MTPKERAGEAALALVRSGMVVGLGTGSTAECFIQSLGRALADGRLRDIRGVPTSNQSQRLAQKLGIPIVTLADVPATDVTFDGADEIDPNLDLIKGLGGALLREKIVAQNSRRLVIVADGTKRVQRLGTKAPLPVEVVPFCHEAHEAFFRKLGANPTLRRNNDGGVFITDNGNYIYDCRFDGIDNPASLEHALLHRAGVVECGLFLELAQAALVADDQGVQELQRKPR